MRFVYISLTCCCYGTRPMIIEARVNEYAPRDVNQAVPYTPAEIAADAKECFDAGASIVHFHARNDDGTPAHDKARCKLRGRANQCATNSDTRYKLSSSFCSKTSACLAHHHHIRRR